MIKPNLWKTRRRAAGVKHRPVGVTERRLLGRLQSLDDAIAYRRARIAVPCADCDGIEVDRRCDDHACDLMLIAAYQRSAAEVILILSGPVVRMAD
jgi:hypothetical protein